MSHTKKDQLRSWIYLSVVVFTTIPISGAFYSFGVFLDIFLREYGASNSKAGWIGSVLLFSAGISSLFGVYLYRYFGLRRVMFVCAAIVVLVFIITPIMPSLELIFLTYSIPFGIVTGMHESISVVSLREYFSKKLGLATAVRYVGNATGPMVFSYLIPIIYESAGWHKMMSCFSALGLVFIVFAVCYKPFPRMHEKQDSSAMLHTKQENYTKMNLLQATKWLLKDKRALMVLAGVALFSVVEYTPNMFMIQHTQSLGFALSKSKWILVVFSLFSIISRMCFATIADRVMKLQKIRIVLSAVLILFGLFSVLVSFTQSVILITVYMGGIGVLDGMYWPMLSMAAMEMNYQLSDIMFSLMLAATAFGYLFGPPAVGWLYDITDNFPQVLYAVSAGAVTAGIFVLSGTFWKSPKKEMCASLTKSVVETSATEKCSLVVLERETVI